MTQAELEEEYKALEEAHVRWRPYSFLGSRSRIHLDTIRDLMKRLEDMTVRRDEWHATATLAAKDAADMRQRLESAEAENERLRALEGHILNAHGKGLPPQWVYTDSITTVDLLVAECNTLRAELAE